MIGFGSCWGGMGVGVDVGFWLGMLENGFSGGWEISIEDFEIVDFTRSTISKS